VGKLENGNSKLEIGEGAREIRHRSSRKEQRDGAEVHKNKSARMGLRRYVWCPYLAKEKNGRGMVRLRSPRARRPCTTRRNGSKDPPLQHNEESRRLRKAALQSRRQRQSESEITGLPTGSGQTPARHYEGTAEGSPAGCSLCVGACACPALATGAITAG
jgi:hypothetical protein